MHASFWWRKLEKRGHLKGPDIVVVDNITLDLKEIKWEGIDWIKLVQDRDKWWALVNMMVEFEVSGNLTDKLLVSKTEPFSMELVNLVIGQHPKER